MPDVVKHAWTHRPKALGGTDPIEVAPSLVPTVYSRGTSLTATNGTYYTLGFLQGNNPTLTGFSEIIACINDSGDGDGAFYLEPAGEIRVVNGRWLVVVSAWVQFSTSSPFPAYVSLYADAPQTDNDATLLTPSMCKPTGVVNTPTAKYNSQWIVDSDPFDPGDPSGSGTTVSVVLLVEGATVDVTEFEMVAHVFPLGNDEQILT